MDDYVGWNIKYKYDLPIFGHGDGYKDDNIHDVLNNRSHRDYYCGNGIGYGYCGSFDGDNLEYISGQEVDIYK